MQVPQLKAMMAYVAGSYTAGLLWNLMLTERVVDNG